jgi:hypothetical protein
MTAHPTLKHRLIRYGKLHLPLQKNHQAVYWSTHNPDQTKCKHQFFMTKYSKVFADFEIKKTAD